MKLWHVLTPTILILVTLIGLASARIYPARVLSYGPDGSSVVAVEPGIIWVLDKIYGKSPPPAETAPLRMNLNKIALLNPEGKMIANFIPRLAPADWIVIKWTSDFVNIAASLNGEAAICQIFALKTGQQIDFEEEPDLYFALLKMPELATDSCLSSN